MNSELVLKTVKVNDLIIIKPGLDIYETVYLLGLPNTTASSTTAAPTSSAAYAPALAAVQAFGKGKISELSDNRIWARVEWIGGQRYPWWYRLKDLQKNFTIVVIENKK